VRRLLVLATAHGIAAPPDLLEVLEQGLVVGDRGRRPAAQPGPGHLGDRGGVAEREQHLAGGGGVQGHDAAAPSAHGDDRARGDLVDVRQAAAADGREGGRLPGLLAESLQHDVRGGGEGVHSGGAGELDETEPDRVLPGHAVGADHARGLERHQDPPGGGAVEPARRGEGGHGRLVPDAAATGVQEPDGALDGLHPRCAWRTVGIRRIPSEIRHETPPDNA
jgi:hypothetical protein